MMKSDVLYVKFNSLMMMNWSVGCMSLEALIKDFLHKNFQGGPDYAQLGCIAW